MRYLGIDFGEKRIGVAVSDDAESLAVEVGTVERRDDYSAISELRELARERDVEALVVGRPTRLDGRPGDLAPRVERFARRLGAACRLPLHFVDEALTSVEAERELRGGAGRSKPGDADAVAARLLLQEHLDTRNRA